MATGATAPASRHDFVIPASAACHAGAGPGATLHWQTGRDSPSELPMFQVLTASDPQAAAGAHRYFLSLCAHSALLAASIALTRNASAPSPVRPAEQAIPFVAPQPTRATLPAAGRTSPGHTGPTPPDWQPNFGAPDLNPSVLPAPGPAIADLVQATRTGLQSFGSGQVTLPEGDLLTAAAVDDPVEVLEQPDPRYPAALAQGGITGRVELTYVVDTLGRAEPGSLRTLTSTHPAFEAAARWSVLASRFRPARLRGSVVRQLVRQTLTFRMSE